MNQLIDMYDFQFAIKSHPPVRSPLSLSPGFTLPSNTSINRSSPIVRVSFKPRRKLRDKVPIMPMVIDDAVRHGREGCRGASGAAGAEVGESEQVIVELFDVPQGI